MPMPYDRPRVIPATTPDDVTMGEMYRMVVQTSEDIAFIRGKLDTMSSLETRVASLETFRAGVRRGALATFIASIPIVVALASVATNGGFS